MVTSRYRVAVAEDTHLHQHGRKEAVGEAADMYRIGVPVNTRSSEASSPLFQRWGQISTPLLCKDGVLHSLLISTTRKRALLGYTDKLLGGGSYSCRHN